MIYQIDRRNTKRSPNFKDITGQRFGKLIVIDYEIRKSNSGKTYIYWKCICDCGNESFVQRSDLTHGKTKSCGCNTHLDFGVSAFNRILFKYKKRAQIKKLSFNLSEEQFRYLTQQNCYYCGSIPKQINKQKNTHGYYIYNGVDRLDNNVGYELFNCVPCCKICNFSKRDLSKEDFLSHINKIYHHIILKDSNYE